MLSFNPPTPQTALLAAAQQPIERQESSSPFARGRTASEVLPRVYLTDLFTARNESQLSDLGITHVISVLEHAPRFPDTHSLRTLHIPLSDSAYEDILAHLPATTAFIHDALTESPDSRVMVHCLMGISRSATVVCAYLVATAKMTPDEALVAVRAKRGIVCPNLGFRQQLEQYAEQLQGGGQSSASASAGARPGPVLRSASRRGVIVAEAIRRLTGKAQQEPNTGSSSLTSTLTISDVTSAPS